jgi:prepilin-type N-terminal cleavage/methylation domain-containing protein
MSETNAPARHRRRRSQRGYNLMEVMIAIALLGVVMISIMALFVAGRKNVYSGKQMTNAVAIGTRILEDLAPLNKQDIFNGLFAIPLTSAGYGGPVKLGTPLVTYTNCRIRSTDSTVGAPTASDVSTQATGTNPPDMLTKWKNQMGTNLANGSVTLIMVPMNDPTNTPAQFGTASVLQVRVLIQWDEGQRRRELILDTSRAY